MVQPHQPGALPAHHHRRGRADPRDGVAGGARQRHAAPAAPAPRVGRHGGTGCRLGPLLRPRLPRPDPGCGLHRGPRRRRWNAARAAPVDRGRQALVGGLGRLPRCLRAGSSRDHAALRRAVLLQRHRPAVLRRDSGPRSAATGRGHAARGMDPQRGARPALRPRPRGGRSRHECVDGPAAGRRWGHNRPSGQVGEPGPKPRRRPSRPARGAALGSGAAKAPGAGAGPARSLSRAARRAPGRPVQSSA